MGVLTVFTRGKRRGDRALYAQKKTLLLQGAFFYYMAEKEGFEPSVEYNPHTRLAGEHHRPARSSLLNLNLVKQERNIKVAEEVGFEPTVLSYNGFQDRRLQPLGHSSSLCN